VDNNLITEFVNSINALSSNNIQEKLSQIYTQEVEFIDPVKDISGLDNLTTYFNNLYKSVEHCHFTIIRHITQHDLHAIEWHMKLKHRKLDKKNEILLEGSSFIRFDNNKASYHRDYYDMGALVYERLPILGSAVKTVRNAF